ncbi:MAG TPA: methylated-DNA--[protein]-cysteine S-methyltransferase [Candidatus Bathyarchaeia archaeon]|nr:methylated-DNA--[protein]-cysteine S-methyltransferase [Candidatus Bathyarchaeia archaeon]
MIDYFIGYYESPIGTLEIIGTKNSILSCNFTDEIKKEKADSDILHQAIIQIDEYFKGKRIIFDLKLDLIGTDFQKRVWQAVMQIPYGETISYKTLAQKIGNIKAVRAVGNANGKNPLSIFIPCHRVIGSDGSLIGYGGGLDRKKWLINFELKNKY